MCTHTFAYVYVICIHVYSYLSICLIHEFIVNIIIIIIIHVLASPRIWEQPQFIAMFSHSSHELWSSVMLYKVLGIGMKKHMEKILIAPPSLHEKETTVIAKIRPSFPCISLSSFLKNFDRPLFFYYRKKTRDTVSWGKNAKLKKKIMIHGFKTMQEIGVSEKAIF